MNYIYISCAIVAALGVGYLCGTQARTARDVDALERRVRQMEIGVGQWQGRITALEQIGVEVRVVDTSAHLDALWVMELRELER